MSRFVLRFWPLATAAVFLLVAAACTWQGLRRYDSAARHLYIAGELNRVGDADIAAAARPHLTVDFFDLDLDGIRDAVAAEPWLASVSVHRRWPDGVVIRVREHRPVALWRENGVVTADGSVIAPRGGQRPADLPVLAGPGGSQDRLLARLQGLHPALAAAGHDIRRLELNARGAWRVVLVDGLELRLGRSDIERRAQRFAEHAVPALGERLQRAGYVDLRYSDGFAVGGSRATDIDRESEHEQAA